MQHRMLFVAVSMALGLTVSSVALAASADAAPAAQASTKKDQADPQKADQLQTVTVTARKRKETLQDVPIAVTAFTAQKLAVDNVQTIGDLQGKVPNLQIYAARGSNTTLTAYIRGIGQSDPLWGVDPGVGIYLDDVYIARPQGALLDVFDVQRIEVLRGPQGTLYGKNTIGGAIKYISKPLPTKFEATAQATVGTYSERDLKASIGGASAGKLVRTRLSVASLHHKGFGENLITGGQVSNKNTNAARLSIGLFPAGNWDAQLDMDVMRDNSGVRGAKRLNVNPFDPNQTPPNKNNYDVQNGMPNINPTHMSGASLRLDYFGLANWSLKSVSAYRQSDTDTYIDFDTLPQPITDVHAEYSDHQFSQEFQANYDAGGKLHGVAGLYYFDGSAGGHVFNNFLGLSFGGTNGDVKTKSYAFYADGSYDFTPDLSLDVGMRYTDEKKSAFIYNVGYSDGSFSTINAVLADFNGSKTFRNLSPKVSLEWHANQQVMLYGSYSAGFKSGGFNIRANCSFVPQSCRPFQDERVDSYELGSKMNFFGNTLLINTALFHNVYKNIQLSVFTAYDSNGDGTKDAFFGDFTNAGKGHIDGAEVELEWMPAPNWTVRGHGSYLHTKYDRFISSGVNVADQQKFTNAPRFSGGLSLENTTPLGNGGSVTTRVNYTYQTKVYPTTDLSEAIAQDAYGLLNAGVILDTGGHWSYALQGTNLTNKAYRTSGYNIGVLGILTGFYGPPRQVTLSARYTF
jgi:iron complex outermembrane recepter protein